MNRRPAQCEEILKWTYVTKDTNLVRGTGRAGGRINRIIAASQEGSANAAEKEILKKELAVVSGCSRGRPPGRIAVSYAVRGNPCSAWALESHARYRNPALLQKN